ncbi:MAG TPA: methyltransferase domain-containing protein [Candidatus Paceibacterota bacterium]|jgi:ubiquinone/menaquinone biosynthesis C-methylase UbiE|nr:methyltransferase domain-containing protein [Candidatus Paceibacterota bacterium]
MFSDPNANLAKLSLSLGMKVVDLGAGSGFYSIESARRVGPSGRVYAVDIQKDILERIRTMGATQNLRNIEVVWANIEKIGGTKLREGVADRVIASNVLFQIEHPDEFALEIKRLLKPGGKVMVIDWNGGSPLSPKTLFSSSRAQMLFEKIGFKLDQSFGAGDHHYGLILTRS